MSQIFLTFSKNCTIILYIYNAIILLNTNIAYKFYNINTWAAYVPYFLLEISRIVKPIDTLYNHFQEQKR